MCTGVSAGGVPVLAVDLVCSQGVVKHQDLVDVLQPWSGVVAVLQLHRGVQQRKVAPDDEGVRAVWVRETNTPSRQDMTGYTRAWTLTG